MEENKQVEQVETPQEETTQTEQPQTQNQNNTPNVDTEIVFKELKKYIDIKINEVMDNFKRNEEPKEEVKEEEVW